MLMQSHSPGELTTGKYGLDLLLKARFQGWQADVHIVHGYLVKLV